MGTQTKKYIFQVISLLIIISSDRRFPQQIEFIMRISTIKHSNPSLWQDHVCTRIPGIPLTPPAYQYDTGRGGAGYSLGSGTIYCPYLFWTDVGKWPTNEFYVSFWMRYPSRTYPDGDSHWNVKLFYPHWDGVNSYVHYSATGDEGAYYSAHNKNGGTLEQSRWPSTRTIWTVMASLRIYINFAQGISRFWYDGVLKIDSNYGAGVGQTT
jgi:hypothetical protein